MIEKVIGKFVIDWTIIAMAANLTASAKILVHKKVNEATRCITTLNFSSNNSYIDVTPCLKNNGISKKLTKILPKIYPNASWRNVQSPLYAMPGILIKVKTDVSVATMENIAVTHETLPPAKKKSFNVLLSFDLDIP